MRILLSDVIENKKLELDYYISILNDFQYNLSEPFDVAATFILLDNGIGFKLKFSAKVRFNCDRCLEIFSRTIDIIENRKLTLEEFGDEFDLKEEIKQDLLLNVPIKMLCDENCSGLCQKCGINLNKLDCDCFK